MAALLLAVPSLGTTWGSLVIAVMIALGGMLGADRVAELLAWATTVPCAAVCAAVAFMLVRQLTAVRS